MLQTVKLRILRALHVHRRNPIIRRIGSLSRTVYHAYEHPGYDFATNGEEGLLHTLRGADLNLILDIGANHGNWTKLLLSHHPKAHSHLFEIATPTFDLLAKELAEDSRVSLHHIGFGLEDTTVKLHYYPSQDGLATATLPIHNKRPSHIIEERVTRGDSWAEGQGIDQIDFMKIDVEGMEFDVLRGFGSFITEGRVRFIQFEHHFGRAILHDFHSLLGEAGFRIGKIYMNHVDFSEYCPTMENGIGPNYLAVRKDQSAWIDCLNKGWNL